jgi:hypothetical protein
MTGKVTASAHLRGINPGPPSYTAKKSRGGVAMRTLTGLGFLIVLLVTAIIPLRIYILSIFELVPILSPPLCGGIAPQHTNQSHR